MDSPNQTMEDLETVEIGWEKHAPADELNEIKLAEYKAQVEKSRDVRRRLKDAELVVAALINERDDTDKESWKMRGDVVNGAKLSRKHGPNSSLYESFGYKRQSEYDSGLTRDTKDEKEG